MIVKAKWMILAVATLLMLIGCTSNLQSLPPSNQNISQHPVQVTAVATQIVDSQENVLQVNDSGIDLILAATGDVYLKRINWPEYIKVGFGTEIDWGDLILSKADTTILCSDFTVHIITGEQGSPCYVREPQLTFDGVQISSVRTPTIEIPYILYPRRSAIINPYPVFRWNDTGASSYTASLILDGEIIWTKSRITGTEFQYPQNAPSLQPSADNQYLLQIVDDDAGQTSKDDPSKGLGFRLLTIEDAERITIQTDTINQLPKLDQASKQFVQALFYAREGLYGDALLLLDEVSKEYNTPNVHLWRGNLWVLLRLNNNDGTHPFNAAVVQAQTKEDLFAEAKANESLWMLTREDTYYNAAIGLYGEIGDVESVFKLSEEHK